MADFGEELVGVEFGDGDADGVVHGATDAGGHEFAVVFEARPASALPFHELETEFGSHGNFDGTASDLAVAHGAVAIAEIEKRPGNIDWEIEGVAWRDFGSVHIAAEFGGDDGAASFAVGGSDADATEEGLERKLRFEVGVESLESDELFLGVDGVIPGALGEQGFFKHGRPMSGIGGAEAGAEGAHTLFAVDFEIEDVDDEGVAGLRAVDEERAG